MGGLAVIAFIMRETALFAAFGFLVLGAGDLIVDLIWIGSRLRRRADSVQLLAAAPGRLAIFVPAWDEAAVIGAMLRHARGAFASADYRLYVGCYPNDASTIAAVRAVGWDRLRLVIGPAGIM